MPKVSVIIPMYNAQNTIEECLDSILGQTIFRDLEVIIVDDCSTDSSFDKANYYEKKTPENIALIKLDQNGGPGNARNIAMSYANGEYIGFVDADDAIVPTMYEKLYNEAIRTDSDFVDSGFYSQSKDEAVLYTSDDLTGKLDDAKKSSLLIHGGYTVTKIFRRSFLSANHIKFREEYMLEDFDFLAEIIARANSAANVKEILYIYRDTSSSLSKAVDVHRYIKYNSDAMAGLYSRTSILQNYPGIRDAVEFLLLRLYSFMLNTCLNSVYLGQNSKAEIIPLLDSLRQLKNATVQGDYTNHYVKQGISSKDIMIMQANDKSAEAVLALQ